MVATLRELAIPDYTFEQWSALDDLKKYAVYLEVQSDGEEELDSPIDDEVRQVYEQSFERHEDEQETGCMDRDYTFFDGWDEALGQVSDRRQLFSFLKKMNALDKIVYHNRSSKWGTIPYFTNNFVAHFEQGQRREEIEFLQDVRDGGIRLHHEGDVRKSRRKAAEKVRVLTVLDEMLQEDGITSFSNFDFDGCSFEGQRLVFPYHAVLRRQHKATREMLGG